ncbi:hypothetical protein EV191_10758 [Tamaricihabitans halophyticus]|uniref:Voltage-gated potassium channel n=1 Tax=Tamaricihabitans halophyticus TaxID=1262583 RepID=A0A4R2QMX8_9PSEU|nr:hypothetical protein [Tamaricihabitans halophyticus]TCP50797.1 hypothetical protein EV191_10758 [Tamaricihabitans halophyticus]
MSDTSDSARATQAEWLEERLAVPVIIAAIASVPAVFLMMTSEPWTVVGEIINWISLSVLAVESLVLLWLSPDRFAWLRIHKWPLLTVAAAVPAVVFAIGPVQVLRAILAIGALRVLDARRILRAGSVLRRRAAPSSRWATWLTIALVGLTAAFVAAVLANPDSTSRRFLAYLLDRFGVIPVIGVGLVAAMLIAVAGLLWRYRRRAARARDVDR